MPKGIYVRKPKQPKGCTCVCHRSPNLEIHHKVKCCDKPGGKETK